MTTLVPTLGNNFGIRDRQSSVTRKLCVRRPKEDGLQIDNIYLWAKTSIPSIVPQISSSVISFGFEMNVIDDCVYHKFSESKYIFLVLYVDDILFATNDIGMLHETKIFLSINFKMKDLGDASFELGIEILREQSQSTLRLSQKSYIDKIFKRFHLQDCKPCDTPVAKGDNMVSISGQKEILRIKRFNRFPMHML